MVCGVKVTAANECDMLGIDTVVADKSKTSRLRATCKQIRNILHLLSAINDTPAPTYPRLRYLHASIFDGQVEHAGHLAVVGKFEASLSRSPHQDFVENKFVLFQHVNAFSIAKLLRGELTAVVTHAVLFKDGGRV